jgi:molecular chaperone DnaK
MEPAQAVNPDYAVAEGAAIQAGIIEGSIHQEDSIIITDVNPYTLGIRVVDDFSMDRMAVVIPRNVTIPVTRSETYFTSTDYQTVAHIEVYQGESTMASRNHFLGDFEIHGIPSKKAKAERINVEFSYNLNGMLNVKATIPSTGADASIEINMMQDQDAEEEIIDVSAWKEAPHAKQFRTIIRRAERMLKDPKVQEDPLLAEDLDAAIFDLKEAILSDDLELAGVCESDLMYLLDELSAQS